MKFKIEESAFQKFPTLTVAVVIIKDFDNSKNREESVKILRNEEKNLRVKFNAQTLLKNKYITAYCDEFKNFGVDPEKFLPAHLALSKRVVEGFDLPDINSAVNIYNALSIKYLTPFGGEDLESLYGDFVLKFAEGGEQWIPIGGKKSKNAVPGELTWRDDFDLSTRALNWRQCDRTKLTDKSKNLFSIMDGFSDLNKDNIKIAAEEFIDIIEKTLGGKGSIYWIDKNRPSVEIPFESKDIKSFKKTIEKPKKIKEKIYFGLAKEIDLNLKEVLAKIGIKDSSIDYIVEHPANSDFGDYSTSLPLKLTKQLKKNPLIIAEEIVKNFPKNDNIKKVEIVKPGFINFWISDEQLINRLTEVNEKDFVYQKYYLGKNKKVMVEFAHPNTHKLFHIGHLRNISTGESIVRILEASGNKIIRSNYEGDVGLHIAKCLYGLKHSKINIQDLKTLHKKIELIGKMYSSGTKAYDDDEKAKLEIIKINKMIYDRDPEIMSLWTETRQWSLDYFNENYKRFYSHFDRLYFESEFYERGVEIVKEALKKGILEKSQGAIIFNGKKYGLDIRVFVNSLGFPTYEGKEPALAEKEFTDFGELDKAIHVVTPEQTSFFKVTFKVEELLDEKKYKNKQYHLIYEWVKLKEGKMSSREGNIIEANWLIDEVKKKISEKFKCDEETTEILAVASVKYSFLKNGTQTIIHFDIEESIAVDGNSAPYLIYTYVRCQSVLNKAKHNPLTREPVNQIMINNDESNVLRLINQFPEIVQQAAIQLSPNLIANYLYELAQKFNYFYQKNKILESEEKTKQFRLTLTQATSKVIKEGLYLLGIKTVEKM